MASIERTAYPQFKRNPVVRELVTAYTPTDAEVAFVAEYTRQPAHRLMLTILLKTFQRLGYFPVLDEVPPAVVRHIRGALKLRVQVKPANLANASRYRYHRRIRQFLQVRAYSDGGLKIAARAVYEAAAVMDNPADLINVAIEQLVRDRVELPAFSTLDRLTRRIRTLVNGRYFAQIEARLTIDEKQRLEGLLQVEQGRQKSPLHAIKRLPKRSSLQHFQELIDHIAELDELVGSQLHLAGIPEVKRKHFAAEARALDASELRKFRPAKRYAVLVCLIHRARVQPRDDLAEMFIKRMGNIHNRGREELERLRARYREKTEAIVATMSDVVRVLDHHRGDTEAGREIRRLVNAHGGVQTLQADCNSIAAHSGDNHLPLLWPFYKSHRSTILRMVRRLDLASTTEDRSLIDAIELILTQERTRSDWLDEAVDLAFTTQLWRKTIVHRTEQGEERIHRRLFEVCVLVAGQRTEIGRRGCARIGNLRRLPRAVASVGPVRTYVEGLLQAGGAAGYGRGLRQCLAIAPDAGRRADRSGLSGEWPSGHRRGWHSGTQAQQGQRDELRGPCPGNRRPRPHARTQRHRDPVRCGPLDALAPSLRSSVRLGRQDRATDRALRPHRLHLWLQPRTGPGCPTPAWRRLGAHAVVRQPPACGCQQTGGGLSGHHQQLRRPAAPQMLGRWQERSRRRHQVRPLRPESARFVPHPLWRLRRHRLSPRVRYVRRAVQPLHSVRCLGGGLHHRWPAEEHLRHPA
ncbi:hypothetical protein XFF6991_330003 [Xanthomonas phaseoli pv. phaseoli]|uniref:DUF4158 domain-containing protein n=1 Tax=Xanthomonas campestris pv. phaseoli TaxID=317013 RepID=A0A7Z7J1B6_XANCH|nr:hypothetical protein XFF6991_330003 [Xanthomonas phaseoli pv. phaseoli]